MSIVETQAELEQELFLRTVICGIMRHGLAHRNDVFAYARGRLSYAVLTDFQKELCDAALKVCIEKRQIDSCVGAKYKVKANEF